MSRSSKGRSTLAGAIGTSRGRRRVRTDLERHLRETKKHATTIRQRLEELDQGRSMVVIGVGAVQSLVGTYRALEHFARRIGDRQTARLAASIRKDEERMLAVLQERIASLVDDVIRSELKDEPVYDVSKTGGAEAARRAHKRAGTTARRAAKKAGSRTRSTARQARKVPGVARAEGEMKGAVASEQDLATANYDSLNVDEIVERLSELSQIDLAKVDAYERRHESRSTVLSRIESLRKSEPWPGYDEQTVEEIRTTLAPDDAEQSREVREYERRHKERRGVLDETQRSG
jgi:hypothetical protein